MTISKNELENEDELTPFELRKKIAVVIFNDSLVVLNIGSKCLVAFIFLYGFYAILRDVNLI
jgi:hypothetical protein